VYYLVTIVVWPLLWGVGLADWIYHSKNVSDAAYNNSLIGGLIAANLGLLYIVSEGRRSYYLEYNIQHVLWPTYVGMLVGYWWERENDLG
jgi:peptidoglycan/LPS O-acetylase OafA/YrhL